MNISAAIVAFLDTIKDTTLKHFDVIDTYVYDESLDFRGRASQFIARESVFQKEEGEPPKNWVFIIWNRGNLMPSNYNNRPYVLTMDSTKTDAPHADSIATMRWASMDIELKIVTNNMEIGETIEEHLYVNSAEFTTFVVDLGANGLIDCSAQPEKTNTFEKEDIQEVGSVIGIGLSVNINFPVIMPEEMTPVIETIDYKLWQDDRLADPKIIENVIYE